MAYDPRQHHRRSIRLPGYDYSQEGAYFVTICTHNRECISGEIINARMHLNRFGEITQEQWLRTAIVRPNISLDSFVIMPNHLHGIIIITNTRRGDPAGRPYPRSHGPDPCSIGAIIGQFKSVATKRINILRGTPGTRVWQRNYYEHVVRDEDVNLHRRYILDNPVQWDTDDDNPNRLLWNVKIRGEMVWQ